MIDIELCSKINFKKKIIQLDPDEFTREVKRITKEKNITQEQLFSQVEEKTGFSESKIKRWKSGATELIKWEDLESFCDASGAKMENLMSFNFEDKIFKTYIQAREVSENNLVSDDDKYCSKLKSLCEFFEYSDQYLRNLNIKFENVEKKINRLYQVSQKKCNEKIQRKKEEEAKEMEQKMTNEQNKRIQLEKKYKDNFDKYAFLGNNSIKFNFLLQLILAYVCSVALLKSDNIFNVMLLVLVIVLSLIFVVIKLFFRIKVKKIYFEEYEKRDSDFMLFSLAFPTITLLVLLINDFNEISSMYLNPCVDVVFIFLFLVEGLNFMKNIESVLKK